MAKKDPKEAYRAFLGDVPTADNSADKGTKGDNVAYKPTVSDDVGQSETADSRLELVKISARISVQQKNELERRARKEGRLLSELVREAIRKYLY